MKNNHSYSNNQERKIHAMMSNDLEVAMIASCKIYTSGVKGKEWLYSDLEGMLVFILDYSSKARFLVVYDSFSFEKLFQFELYTDFSSHYTTLAPDFRCFEIEGGFIGLQFDIVKEAAEFDFMLKKLEGFLLESLFDSRPVAKHYENIEEKMIRYTKEIKNSLSIECNYDETYAEDGIEIIKPRSFEILNNISFNRETKQFEIGEISDELRNVFIEAGIRKKDLINDLNFAFMMFKKIILGVGENKDLLNNEYLHKEYPQPDDLPYSRNEDISDQKKEDFNNNDNNDYNDDNCRSNPYRANNNEDNMTVNKPDDLKQNNINAQVVNDKGLITNNNTLNENKIQTAENKINKKPNSSLKPNINSRIAPPKNTSSRGIKPTKTKESNITLNSNIPQLKPTSINQTNPMNQPTSINQTNPINQPTLINQTNPMIQPTSINQTNPMNQPTITTQSKPILIIEEKTTSSMSEVKQQQGKIPIPPPMPVTTAPQVPSGNIPLPPPFLGPIFIPPVSTTGSENPQKSRQEELNSIKLKQISEEENTESKPPPSMYEQIKNIKLKAVEKDPVQSQKLMTKNEKNFLQNTLALAIQQRRKNLLKHQEEESDSDEDW